MPKKNGGYPIQRIPPVLFGDIVDITDILRS
jgi:hypothetical protein